MFSKVSCTVLLYFNLKNLATVKVKLESSTNNIKIIPQINLCIFYVGAMPTCRTIKKRTCLTLLREEEGLTCHLNRQSVEYSNFFIEGPCAFSVVSFLQKNKLYFHF